MSFPGAALASSPSDINFPRLLQPYVTAPALPAALFCGKSCWFTLHASAAAWLLLQLSVSGSTKSLSWAGLGRSKERGESWSWRKVTLQHTYFYLSLRDACRGRAGKDKSDTWLDLQEDGMALNRPGLAPVLLSGVHLQEAFILAAMGHANKKDNDGRDPRVNHPCARPRQKCHWCLFALTIDIVVIIRRTWSTISASPCSGIGIHPVRCLVMPQRWFSTYGSLNHSDP